MKRIYCILVFLCLSLSLCAQYVARFSLPQVLAMDSVPDPTITKVNVLIDTLNKTKSQSSLQALISFLKVNTVDTTQLFHNEGDSLLRVLFKATPDSLTKLSLKRFPERKVAILSDEAKTPCAKVYKVAALLCVKNDDAEYELSLVDKKDNPLSKFIIGRPNEELFKDELKRAYYGLCENVADTAGSTIIETVLKKVDVPNLFKLFLIASLNVKDDDVPAGELRITKRPMLNLRVKELSTEYKASQPFGSRTSQREEMNVLAGFKTISPPLMQTALAVPLPKKKFWQQMFTKKPDSFDLRQIPGFTVHNVQIQFQDGFIENIIVLGKWDNDPRMLKFENGFPIAFSTRRDFRMLQHYYLYERTVYSSYREFGHYKTPVSIRLGDLLFYTPNLSIDTKDYSPYNHVYKSDLTDSITKVNLLKEKTSKILELKIYSDLKGFEGDNPNGLVQVEFSKKLNFLTRRMPIPRWRNWFNIGALNFVTPYFTMNKIEKNNKRLVPTYFGSQGKDTMRANVYASTLKLLQHQVFSLGANFNIVTIDIPGFKSTLCMNAGLYFGRTLLQDTMREKIDSFQFKSINSNNVYEFGVNNFMFVPEVSWQIFPDRRYGLSVTQRFIHFKTYSNQVTQVVDSAHYTDYLRSLKGDRSKIDEYNPSRWLGSTEVFAFYRPSEYNKLFFRYRYNWDLGNTRQNFHQLQLGIATYLTHTKKDKKEQQKD